MTKAVIVIPCYNEAERLKTERFSGFLAEHREISLLFVDDGSKDSTAEILNVLCREHVNADVLLLPENKGKAEAVRQGMLHAAGTNPPFIGFWDADLATPLSEVFPMLKKAEQGYIYVSGCRLVTLGRQIRRKVTRHFLGRIFATAVSCHLGLPVYDTQCGAKIFASGLAGDIFSRPFVTKWFFDVEILRRMINRYGRETVTEKSFEYLLDHWQDEKGSKIKYFSALKDFIHLLLTKN